MTTPADDRSSGSDHSIPEPRREPDSGETFPKNAVVGVIGDRAELLKAVDDFRAAGFDPGVLHGERGEQRILHAGDSDRDLSLNRFIQGIFGYENEHSQRHMEEVEAGNFLLVVESHDDEAAERARRIFSDHGGRFVNYYAEWTTRSLIP